MRLTTPLLALTGSTLAQTQIAASSSCLKVPNYNTPSIFNPYTATQLPTLSACCDIPKDILSLDQSASQAAQATAKPGEFCLRRNPAGWFALAEQVCNGFTNGGFNELQTSYPYACAVGTETGRPFSPMTDATASTTATRPSPASSTSNSPISTVTQESKLSKKEAPFKLPAILKPKNKKIHNRRHSHGSAKRLGQNLARAAR